MAFLLSATYDSSNWFDNDKSIKDTGASVSRSSWHFTASLKIVARSASVRSIAGLIR
jgi:hypothetical protein